MITIPESNSDLKRLIGEEIAKLLSSKACTLDEKIKILLDVYGSGIMSEPERP
jgi:hypothetical protein